MRTNLVIDDDLLKEALKVSGLKSKKEVVELGLWTLIWLKKQEANTGYRGRLQWEGDQVAGDL